MSRYIDADALIVNMRGAFIDHIEEFRAITIIKDAPSIDIVFCKECKHWERLNYEAPKEGWCDGQMQMPYFEGRWVDADDFCSCGKRRKCCEIDRR